MSHRLLAATLITLPMLTLAMVGGCKCERSPNPDEANGEASAAPTERWVNTRAHDLLVVEDKRDIELSTHLATELFFDKFPRLRSDWRSRIPGSIQALPGARPRPEPDDPLFHARQSEPVAIVTGYSESAVIVKLLEPVGRIQGYRVLACLASLRVQRSTKLDLALDLERLTKTYGREVRGVHQGSSPEQVRAALGAPSQEHHTKMPGYYRWYYTEEKLQVVFDDNVVLQFGDSP